MAVRRRHADLALACCAASLGIASPTARAGPTTDPTVGRAVFTGVTAPHPTSIELNPAALGLSTTTQIYVAAAVVIDQFAINRQELDLTTGELTPGARIRDVEIGTGANLAALWHPLDRVTLGFALRTPPSERFLADRSALRYHTLGGYQRDYIGGVGFGIRASARFHFGFSITFDSTHLALRYKRDTALDNGRGPGGVDSDCGGTPCGVENPLADETYAIDVQQESLIKGGYIVNLGIVFRIWRDIWVGLAYHTPPGGSVQTELSGRAVVTTPPRDGGVVLTGDSTVLVSYPASVDAEVRAPLGRQLDLHVGGRWSDLSRLYAYDVRIYGSDVLGTAVPEWTVRPRGLRDTFSLWGGIEQSDTGERVRLGARLGVESEGVPANQTSAMTIAPTSFTVDLGGQLRLTPNLILQLTYGLQYFPTVEVTDSAYDPRDRLDCIASGFDYSTAACESVRNGYAIPTAAGDYGRLQHAIRFGVSYVLPFP